MDNSGIEKVIKSRSVYLQWISMTHSIQYMCIAKAKYIGSFLALHRYLHTLFQLDWSKKLQIRVRKRC